MRLPSRGSISFGLGISKAESSACHNIGSQCLLKECFAPLRFIRMFYFQRQPVFTLQFVYGVKQSFLREHERQGMKSKWILRQDYSKLSFWGSSSNFQKLIRAEPKCEC